MPGKSKYTIEDAIRIAQGRGGMCLSTEYKNNRTKMLWQCDKLHEPWEAVFKEINISGTWCPKCAGKITYTIDDCHKVAKERNGVCLSTEYINTDTKCYGNVISYMNHGKRILVIFNQEDLGVHFAQVEQNITWRWLKIWQ